MVTEIHKLNPLEYIPLNTSLAAALTDDVVI